MLREKEADYDEEEEESPLSKSPKLKNKKEKYLKFKNILTYLLVMRAHCPLLTLLLAHRKQRR